MPRNLDRRVEIVFPVIEEELKEKALHILHVELEDNVKARVMQPDGTYEKLDKRGKVLINSQEQFCAEAKAAVPDQNPGNNQAVYSGRTGGINLQKTVDNTVIRWYSQMVVKKQVEYPLSPKRNRAT